MDNLPEAQVQVITQQRPFPKIPIIISGVILLLVIIIFLGLKYFNLPKTTTKPTPKPILLTNKTTPKITLSCPVPKEFCSKAKEIPSSGFHLGLGIKLPANTPLLAPFDGKFMMIWQEEKQASYSATLKITDSTEAFSAVYLFALDKLPQIEGKTVEMRKEYAIKKGEAMMIVSGKPVPYRFQEGNSLVFYIYKTDKDLPETRIPLKPEDLSQNISLDNL